MSIFFLIIDFWKYDPPSRIRILLKKNQSCPGNRPKMSEDIWSITTSETEGKLKALLFCREN